ncbi:MAG: hypothetical protein LBB34_00230 [Holosporales bacterium]|nr:hypothetical protein [Holosporales bacterium]
MFFPNKSMMIASSTPSQDEIVAKLNNIIPDVTKADAPSLFRALETLEQPTPQSIKDTLDSYGVICEQGREVATKLYKLLTNGDGEQKALRLTDSDDTRMAEVDRDGTIEYSMHNIGDEPTSRMEFNNDSEETYTVTLSGNNSFLSEARFHCKVHFNNLLAAPKVATCYSGASLESRLDIPKDSELTVVGKFTMNKGSLLQIRGKVKLIGSSEAR